MAGERDRVDVDDEALRGYSTAAGRIAEEVRSVGTATLSGANALPDDAFGKLGSEVGLSAAFKTAAQAQLDGVAATASGIAALAQAVGTGLTGYQHQDENAAANVRRAGQPT
jgi:excreted virulence factor EspC (type VII ESX diderm)